MPRVAIVATPAPRRESLRARIAAAGVDVVSASATLEEAAHADADVLLVQGRALFAAALDRAAEDGELAVVGLVIDRAALADVVDEQQRDPGALRGWALLPETASAPEVRAAIAAADAGLASAPVEWMRERAGDEPAAPSARALAFDADPQPFGAESLTPREQDVLELLSLGLSNRRIAERLGISDHTVKFHVAAIYGKLGVSGRTAAVNRALRRGILKI
jgi:two-component system, NarL family, nitrate/nitrite response regulator NarL